MINQLDDFGVLHSWIPACVNLSRFFFGGIQWTPTKLMWSQGFCFRCWAGNHHTPLRVILQPTMQTTADLARTWLGNSLARAHGERWLEFTEYIYICFYVQGDLLLCSVNIYIHNYIFIFIFNMHRIGFNYAYIHCIKISYMYMYMHI